MQYADGSVREEGVWVYKNSAWVKVGSDQAGNINYLSNGDAEAGNTSGWSLGNVTLTNKFPSGVPTFGSGASANLSFTNSATSPLAGTRSFVLSSSTATTAGNFLASDAFTIDAADLAKVLTIDLSYRVSSGTINASGTSSNSLGIAIYDVTASQWIMPAGVWAITQTSGVGRAVATFQTPITSTQYRLVLFNANATSGAVTLQLDRMSVSPVSVPVGAPVTDWQALPSVAVGTWIKGTTSNPTLGTVATNSGYWRRVGGNLEIKWTYRQTAAGSAGSGQYELDVNATLGLSIDTAKLTASSGVKTTDHNTATAFDWFGTRIGAASIGTDSNANYNGTGGGVYVKDSSKLKIAPMIQMTDNTNRSYVWNSAALGHFGNTNMHIEIECSVPIAGWSSQVQMSGDTDTRVVAARMINSGSPTIGNGVPIPMTSASYDTAGATTLATGRFTAPVTGYYRASLTCSRSAAGNTASLYKNGVFYQSLLSWPSAGYNISGSCGVQLNAGDYIDCRPDISVVLSGIDFSIERLSGPAVVAATELVAASYYCSANFAASATVPINYDSKEFDTHNAVTTSPTAWRFTAPATGTYSISGFTNNASGNGTLHIYKNGSVYKPLVFTNTTLTGTFASNLKLNAGEYIDIRPTAAITVTGSSISSSGSTTTINIARLGF